MRQVSRSAIVPYAPDAMFALVADVEAYPQFLPGCCGARVESRDGDQLVASLQLAKGPLHTSFTTRNRLEPPGRMTLELLDGPFHRLEGEWRFDALGERGCRVSLQLSFEFSSRAKDLLLGLFFETTCSQLVDAFVERARQVYG